MSQRSILVAEDLDGFTEKSQRRGQVVRNMAQEVSRLLHEELELLYVEDTKTYPNKKLYHDQDIKAWHQEHEESLQKIAKVLSVKSHVVIKSGTPAQEILKTIHTQPRPELVIMGTQGRQGLEKWILGSVAEEVISHSERPVMVLGPLCQEKHLKGHLRRPLKFIVATDLTRTSRPAEQYAASLAARCRGRLFFYHSVAESLRQIEEASYMSGFASFDFEQTLQKISRDARILLEKKVARCRKKLIYCDYKVGNPRENFLEGLSQGPMSEASMMIMGTHHRNSLLRAFLGSNARDAILYSEIPVVIVPSRR